MNTILHEQESRLSHLSIYGPLEEFDSYKDIFEVIYGASESDKIVLHLNSPGGRVDIGTSLISAINMCKGLIKVYVEAPCYSMGAILALSGDDLLMADHTFLMFHDYSTLMYGKGNELEKQLYAEREILDAAFRKWCSPFLTNKELNQIMNGHDVYIHYNDKNMKQRMKRHFK